MADPVSMNPWIPVPSAFGGSIITGLIAIITNRINKKSEGKKQLQSLLFSTAIKNWETSQYMAEKAFKAGKNAIIFQIDSFLIHMIKFNEIILDSKLTKDNVSQKIKEIHEISRKASENYLDLKPIDKKD